MRDRGTLQNDPLPCHDTRLRSVQNPMQLHRLFNPPIRPLLPLRELQPRLPRIIQPIRLPPLHHHRLVIQKHKLVRNSDKRTPHAAPRVVPHLDRAPLAVDDPLEERASAGGGPFERERGAAVHVDEHAGGAVCAREDAGERDLVVRGLGERAGRSRGYALGVDERCGGGLDCAARADFGEVAEDVGEDGEKVADGDGEGRSSWGTRRL